MSDVIKGLIITVIGGILVYLATTVIKKIGKIDFKKLISYFDKFWQKIRGIKDLISNRIREKIIGKENLELLKELKILKGNKLAIDFLNKLRERNIEYEALNAFINLYSNAADSISPIYPYKFKEAYKNDNGADSSEHYSNVYKLREEIFEKLIKKYSK